MLTIRIRRRRIKIFNWIIFIGFIILLIYILGLLFFSLPLFNKNYSYKVNTTNYKINNNITFKTRLLYCKVKEEINVDTTDKTINKQIRKDLINDGFVLKKDKFIRTIKSFGICKDEKEAFERYSKNNYIKYELNGKDIINLKYKDIYKENYVTFKINNKKNNNINISSNINNNKIGTYFVSYKLNIKDDYNIYLYRKIKVYDDVKPEIKLNGSEEITINYGSKYHEEGFSAKDNYDGNLTKNVVVKDDINTKKAGTYKISYKVSDSSGNIGKAYRIVNVIDEKKVTKTPKVEVKDGITYIDGILIVNKEYSLPKTYDPGVNKEAMNKLKEMQTDASSLGLDLKLVSGYRSYITQDELHKNYVKKDGEEQASTYSALPGHSEHQTGLAFDLGMANSSFEGTDEAKWLEENAHLYGFIVRYPKGKTNITGYVYEPWHVRYLGINNAKKVKESGLTLEEYLGI